MDPVRNPFSPGAGSQPPALVGRDKQLRDIDIALQRMLIGRDARGQLLIGRRGVGKTVLLNEFERIGARHRVAHAHFEVSDDGELAARVAAALRRILLDMSVRYRVTDRFRRALGVLKAFSLKLPDGPEIGFDIEAVPGPADSGRLDDDLAGLFEQVGEVAVEHNTAVLITIDELHYLPAPSLAALIVGLHRVNQRRLPILMCGAGLPSLPTLAGEAKSYAERMFLFPDIGPLDHESARAALIGPSEAEGVMWEPAALDAVVSGTQGYPYFLQEFGKQAWDIAAGPNVIDQADVQVAAALAVHELDEGFFRVRTGKLPSAEMRYLRAMAELAPLPVRSASVAELLGGSVSDFGPVRDRLIKRGICFAPGWGELDFTVPLFAEYLLRTYPPLQ